MLENKHKRKVAFHPSVNHMGIDKTDSPQLIYDSDDDSIPPLNDQCSSSDESSDDESSNDGSEVFEFDEPAVNKQTAEPKYCELCNGTTDHFTWECKKFDSSNIPVDERRKIKQCRIKFHKQLVELRKEKGLPPPPKPSTTPPKDRPPLPRDAILPDELPTPQNSTISSKLPTQLPQPKVSVVSTEQKEALRNSSLSEDEESVADPNPTLAFNLNADNFTALQEIIKQSVNADDSDVSIPARFDQPFVNRNLVQTERNSYVPMDDGSDDDFDQEHYDAYGYAGGSLKNF